LSGKKVKLSPTQRMIVTKMRETIVNNPQAATLFDVDMGHILKLKDEYAEKQIKITVTAFLIKALSLSLEKSPNLNSRFVDNELYVYDEINVGVAMSTEKGLIVPIIANTEKKTVEKIADDLHDLRERFKNNKLTMDDFAGGTVTISSLSGGRNDIILPILNNNECLLVGVARTKKTPAVMDDGTVGVKDMANISIMNNHCITYGMPIGIFCTDYAEIIEKLKSYL